MLGETVLGRLCGAVVSMANMMCFVSQRMQQFSLSLSLSLSLALALLPLASGMDTDEYDVFTCSV